MGVAEALVPNRKRKNRRHKGQHFRIHSKTEKQVGSWFHKVARPSRVVDRLSERHELGIPLERLESLEMRLMESTRRSSPSQRPSRAHHAPTRTAHGRRELESGHPLRLRVKTILQPVPFSRSSRATSCAPRSATWARATLSRRQ
jgi:hypothetical protein